MDRRLCKGQELKEMQLRNRRREVASVRTRPAGYQVLGEQSAFLPLRGLQRSGADPPQCFSHACLPMAFIAISAHRVCDGQFTPEAFQSALPVECARSDVIGRSWVLLSRTQNATASY